MNQDATDVIKEQVADTLSKYRVFYKRLFRAYPHIKLNANIMKFREFMDEQMSKTMRLVKIKDKDK